MLKSDAEGIVGRLHVPPTGVGVWDTCGETRQILGKTVDTDSACKKRSSSAALSSNM